MNDQFQILDLIPVVVALVVLAGWAVYAIISRRKLKDLAEALGGKVVSSVFRRYARVSNQGVEVRIETKARSRYTPPYLILEQLSRLGFKMTIDKKGFSLSKSLRLPDGCKKISPQPAWIENYGVIRASDELRASNFFMDPKKQAAVEFFIKDGFTEITAAKKKLILKKPNYRDSDLEPAKLKETLGLMREFIGEPGGTEFVSGPPTQY
jgi:hypothetical protein